MLATGRALVVGGSNASLLTQTELSPLPAKVSVTTAFTPKTIKVKKLSGPVRWSVTQGTHTIVESTGLGLPSGGSPTPLFQSSSLTAPASFADTVLAAGVYHYQSTLGEHPALKGTIKVPAKAALTADPSPRIDVRWSTSRMADYVFDVEYRFQPAGGSFGPWTPWSPARTTGGWTSPHALYTPSGAGVYQFKARLHEVTTGMMSGFSPAAKVTVPG
jgi:plastocyanin